ncbi:MAG: ABC transporter permease [Chloroflexi bacterium]|nr:ABC transporter permease [Chloroflexota bacterium]MBI2983263.1 ABC transporter permease [Chloroflexota bacterium]
MAAPAIAARGIVRTSEARRAGAGFWSDAWWRLRHDPTTMIAISVIVLLVVLAASADLLADNFFKWSFSRQDLTQSYRKPTLDDPAFWFGADNLGRSQIVRLLYGARVSLFVGFFGMLVTMTIGVTMGVTSGYFRGKWDDVVVWLVSTLNSIPTFFLLLIIGFMFRLNAIVLPLFLGALGWLGICNLARGQTFSLRERDYVTAARTIGASHTRIMFRHIFPNVIPLLIVIAMIDVGGLILTESALSFLGFGIQPPQPSWGNMLSDAPQFYFRGAHLIYFPGILISITVLCAYLIGDGLRDALDPRLRGSFSADK